MTSKRLNNYGKINRDKTISFTWDNKKYNGLEGDSLASALLANNIGVVGRSFKYHRPRGIFSSGVEESGALVTIGSKDRRDPNVRATTQELYNGLEASGQNAFPNVNFDLAGINNYLGIFLQLVFIIKLLWEYLHLNGVEGQPFGCFSKSLLEKRREWEVLLSYLIQILMNMLMIFVI